MPRLQLDTTLINDILDNIDLGIVILDVIEERVEFRNAVSFDILSDAEAPSDYLDLFRMLACAVEDSEGETPVKANTIRLDNRLIGYSHYSIGDRYRCIFLRNITEKARLESIAQAVNTMDNIGLVFSGIRHEIGNPLNSIKITMTVLRNNLDTFPPERIEEYIDRSLKEISRIEFLLRSLRNFSLYESVDCRNTDLGAFLEDFCSLVQRDLEKKGVQFDLQLPKTPLLSRVDTRALHQALLNLVANAVDALAGRDEPQLRVSAYFRDDLVWLLVRDNGCGMDEEQQTHLFQPFNTSKSSGNGLGLVITRKLLALMNGSVEIQSRKNVGTTVFLTMPPATGGPEATPAGSSLSGGLEVAF